MGTSLGHFKRPVSYRLGKITATFAQHQYSYDVHDFVQSDVAIGDEVTIFCPYPDGSGDGVWLGQFAREYTYGGNIVTVYYRTELEFEIEAAGGKWCYRLLSSSTTDPVIFSSLSSVRSKTVQPSCNPEGYQDLIDAFNADVLSAHHAAAAMTTSTAPIDDLSFFIAKLADRGITVTAADFNPLLCTRE